MGTRPGTQALKPRLAGPGAFKSDFIQVTDSGYVPGRAFHNPTPKLIQNVSPILNLESLKEKNRSGLIQMLSDKLKHL